MDGWMFWLGVVCGSAGTVALWLLRPRITVETPPVPGPEDLGPVGPMRDTSPTYEWCMQCRVHGIVLHLGERKHCAWCSGAGKLKSFR